MSDRKGSPTSAMETETDETPSQLNGSKSVSIMNGGVSGKETHRDDANGDVNGDFEDVELNGVVDEKNHKTADTAEPESSTKTEQASAVSPYRKFLCWDNKPPPMNGTELGVWESSLEDRANVLSSWLLSYMTPLLQLGARKVLDAQDIGVPSQQDRAERAFSLAQAAWEEQLAKAEEINVKRKAAHNAKLAACKTDAERAKVKPLKLVEPSMYTALVKSFGACAVIVSMLYYVVSALLTFVPVLILNDLVKYFQSKGTTHEYHGYAPPWVEVAALGVVPFLVSILQTRNLTVLNHCAVFVRTAASTLLYRKSLRVSAAGRAKTSTGQVVNMMSNDTQQLQRFLQFAGMIFVAPLQIIIALVLVYRQVGNATWVGVGFMIFLAPINVVIFSVLSRMRRKVLKYSDLRVKMMNEILAGIRIIKFYAWERPFAKEVARLRAKELRGLNWLAYVSAIGFSLILLSAPIIQPVLVFLVYVSIQSKPLDPATAFTTVALFNILRFPFAFLPMGLLQYIQSKVSLRRLERYLALPELPEYVIASPPPGVDPSSPTAQVGSIAIVGGSFSWVDPNAEPIKGVNEEEEQQSKKRKESRRKSKAKKDDSSMAQSIHSTVSAATTTEEGSKASPITLQDITVTIEPGQLVAVVGTVGSGKSSLLSAILGEMETIGDSKVYIPKPENHDHKSAFMSYCSQTPWIVNDTLRDNILFGREYDQDRYDEVVEACALPDDLRVLPAGDRTEIGERGINLSGGQKARVSLARALYDADTKIVLLDDPLSAVDAHVGEHLFASAITGDVSRGMTRILVTHHVHFLSRCDSVIVMDHGRILHQGHYEDLIAQGVDFAGAVDVSKHQKSKTDGDETESETASTTGKEKKAAKKKDVKTGKATGELTKDEEKMDGSVAGSAYIHYARAGGLWNAFFIILIQTLGRASEVMSTFWLALWAQRAGEAYYSGHPMSTGKTNFYVGIYGLFGLLGVLGLTFRSIIMANQRLNASKKLHNDLAESVLHAPVSFFDITPLGRVLNRFSADMDKIDLQLTQSLSQGLTTIYSVLGAIAAISASTKGTFLVPLIPLGYIFYLIQKWYRKTSTELQRLNSIANSPIFADFSQILSGTSTVRAYGEEQRFFDHCKASFDNMNSSYVQLQLISNWLALRLDALGGLVGAFVAGVAVATAGFIPAGWLGLALSYSIEVTGYLKFGVRMMATVEADLTSVERIMFYTYNIPKEAPDAIPEADPDPDHWPSKGEIEFSNASMRYRDGPLVLKDISFTVKPGEKVGVVGRTGSGKSSLMVALFRITEIEGGSVLIDSVDASKIGTTTLRLKLSIIPQDPVIFSNTVRYNLDPFGTCTEEDLWEVLGKVNMADVISALPNGLDEQVSEGGENFSQGQRQLICIARSLLRKPKILVLDEATASIDNKTDSFIQQMIRENFADATVLTIAHRLNTIMDSDRILVLDDGRVAEFDSPSVLLNREGGIFRALVEKSRAAHGADDMAIE